MLLLWQFGHLQVVMSVGGELENVNTNSVALRHAKALKRESFGPSLFIARDQRDSFHDVGRANVECTTRKPNDCAAAIQREQ